MFRSRELMRIVRDLPVTLDLDAAKLDDYDREAVIRLFREYEFRTLIDRLPALAGESPEATVAALREVRESGSIPAAQVAGRPEGWGPAKEGRRGRAGGRAAGARCWRRAPDCSWPWTSTRWRKRPSSGGRRAGRRSDRRTAPRGRARPSRRCRRSPDRARRRHRRPGPDRGRRPRRRRGPRPPGSRPRRRSASRIVLDDPRPLRGEPLALAVAGADGRAVAAEGPRRQPRSGGCSSGSTSRSSATR